MRIIPVTLWLARFQLTSPSSHWYYLTIYKLSRSLCSLTGSFASLIHLSLIILAAPLTQQQADSYIIIPHLHKHRINKKIHCKLHKKITQNITQKIPKKITQKSTQKITQKNYTKSYTKKYTENYTKNYTKNSTKIYTES